MAGVEENTTIDLVSSTGSSSDEGEESHSGVERVGCVKEGEEGTCMSMEEGFRAGTSSEAASRKGKEGHGRKGQESHSVTRAGASCQVGVTNIRTKEEEDAIWAKLPKGAKEICEKANGVLFVERYETFQGTTWPFGERKGVICNPRTLALAGLKCYRARPPAAQCVVCLKIFEKLKSDMDPWVLHSTASPECMFVKLGRKEEPDDYSMLEIIELGFKRVENIAERIVKEKEIKLKKQLFELKKMEEEWKKKN